jgi:hypothetical protein
MSDAGRFPAGTPTVMLASGRLWALLNLASYQIAPDGDLVLISKGGRVISLRPGLWIGLGTLEHGDGGSWIALDHLADVA